MLSSLFGNWFPLVFAYTWKIDELSQIWFSFLISLVELPLMFVLMILLSFALLLIAPLSVLKSYYCLLFYQLILLLGWQLIFLLSLLTKIWFPLLTEILWEWCCKFANNDSMIQGFNCLFMSCCFRLSICSFKALISRELLFQHFCSVSIVKSWGVPVLQDASFVKIVSRDSYSKIY